MNGWVGWKGLCGLVVVVVLIALRDWKCDVGGVLAGSCRLMLACLMDGLLPFYMLLCHYVWILVCWG